MLVGVSGGADSVHLVETLASLVLPDGMSLEVAHVNHGIRGEAAAEDARFVGNLARRLGLPFHLLLLDRSSLLRGGRASEGRLRQERYRAFEELMARRAADALFLAHNLDDRVESVLLAALRGAGLKGLRGMPRRRRLSRPGQLLVRPYFGQPAALLRAELLASGSEFRTDATNLDLTYLRNEVRHSFLPTLRRELGADLDRKILRLSRLARLLWRRADRSAGRLDPLGDSDHLHAALSGLAGRPLGRRLSRTLQETVREEGRRKLFSVGRGTVLAVEDGEARRLPSDGALAPSLPFRLDLRLLEDAGGRLMRAVSRTDRPRLRERLEGRGRIYLDAEKIDLPLCVRHRQPGDCYQPLGWSQPGRLKTQWIARGVDRACRTAGVILEDRRGIVAVEGLPPSARGAVSSSTRKLLRVDIRRAGDPSPSGR